MQYPFVSTRLATAALLAALAPGIHALPNPASPSDDLHPAEDRLAPGELRLESHGVSVDIAPGFATTTVDQVLFNPGDADVAARWSFPMPDEAALCELSILAGEVRLEGEVVEKHRAREILRREADEGRTAALAEQDSFYEYIVEITRVPARGRVSVRIVYLQPVEVDGGVGRYVYPLREGNTRDEGPSDFWTMEKVAERELRFDVDVRAAFPVEAVHCTSHPSFAAQPLENGRWSGELALQGAPLEQDLVLYWRLAADTPARVELFTHRREGAAEGTWLAVVTPGSDLAPISGGTDWAFVLDVSGSMVGDKLRVLKRGVSRALDALAPEDRVHLVAFEGTARDVTRGWQAMDPEGRKRVRHAIDSLEAGGGTNIFAGLQRAYDRLDGDRPTGVILVSDGVANHGPSEYRDLIALAHDHDVRLFTFVMGNGANTVLLEDLAEQTGGHAASISVDDDLEGQLLLAQNRLSHEALHGVELELDGAVVRYPEHLPSLYLGQQLVAVGRYDEVGESELRVTARISGEPVTWTLPVVLPEVDGSVPEVERIYALAAIEDLQREAWLDSGDVDEARDAVTDLALAYSLVTDYTSMIVVEEERKEVHGIGDRNARRRGEERRAAETRARENHRPQVATGARPLGGARAEHAPTRYAGNRGGGGSGAIGPAYLLLAAALGFFAYAKRKTG